MICLVLLSLLFSSLEPPTDVTCRDVPNDEGGEIAVTWTQPASDKLLGFRILRMQEENSFWDTIAFVGRLARRFVDDRVINGIRYRYRVVAVAHCDEASSEPSTPSVAAPQWFNMRALAAFIGTILLSLISVYFISMARRNRSLFIRRIAGLDAVEEALGRATEMGRATLYVPGLSSMSDVATIASLNILGEVAGKTARFGTPLIVPNRDPIVYTVAHEVVKEAYAAAGRADAFHPDIVFFVTTDQFAFAAAVDGIMVRERPATNFLIGMFWAESLILAETGAATGAIQIAGTDAVHQLPFFITACDYTLIGEELYAASAYLSREPLLLGAVKGQDFAKAVIIGLIVLGSILALVFRLPVTNWL